MVAGLCSCSDELPWDGVCPEGEEAVISLSVVLPEADVMTRSDMATTDANNVHTLWVGIYNATTGQQTFNAIVSDNPGRNQQYGFTQPTYNNAPHTTVNLKNISTRSGMSYIVAVANPKQNTGYKLDGDGNLTEGSLDELLTGAKTWEEFLAITLKMPGSELGKVSLAQCPVVGTGGLPMSGIYVDAHKTTAQEWEDLSPTAIMPGTTNNTLSGTIHLRRPWSQVKFEIEKTGNIIDFEPTQYRIFNIPVYGWLFDRKQTAAGGNFGTANAGDLLNKSPLNNPAYVSSPLFRTIDFEKDGDKYKFDFWMPENKRTGLSSCGKYGDRELEYLTGNTNTGVYKSLCPTSAGDVNNVATFVEISGRVTYKEPTSDAVNGQGKNPSLVDSLSEYTGRVRVADVKYTVHMGYIGDDARDFNLYRNSQYTYKVKIESVYNIMVEAFRVGDPQPGAEGIVSDVDNTPLELDCHYSQFNVHLTSEELKTFTYDITTYDKDVRHRYYVHRDIQSQALLDSVYPKTQAERERYFRWVQLAYVGPGEGKETDVNRYKFVPYDPKTVKDLDQINGKMEAGWYTVFVSEYSYEDKADETGGGNPNWPGYVNQPDRQIHIYVRTARAGDNESLYFQSKYNARQHSIQTYFQTGKLNSTRTAVGVEHHNETLGSNYRWLYSKQNINETNGRKVTWEYINATSSSRKWSDFVDLYNYQHVNQVTATTVAPAGFDYSARYESLPGLVQILPTRLSGYAANNSGNYFYNALAGPYDPQTTANANTQYIEVLNACMSRNRDNNGNGVIDADELKWYVPTSQMILRVIIGRRALSQPIMDYPSSLPQVSGVYNNNSMDNDTYYHYITSDFRVLWADEGVSLSLMSKPYSPSAWQVRCIRPLGTDLTDGTTATIQPAFIQADNKIVPNYYESNTFRLRRDTPLPMNYPNQKESNIAEYGFEYETSTRTISPFSRNNVTYTALQNYNANNTACNSLNTSTGRTGWRLPNQKELGAMWIADRDILSGCNHSNLFVTCTWEAYTNGILDSATPKRLVCYNETNLCLQAFTTAMNRTRCVRDLTYAEYLEFVNKYATK